MSALAALLVLASGSAAAPALAPFSARYEVWLDGKRSGVSRFRLERQDDGAWLFSIEAEATAGLAGLADAGATQTVRFRDQDGRLIPLEARVESHALFVDRQRTARFDWQAGEVRWHGDIKKSRRGPLPLQADATTAQLLNLQLALAVPAAQAGDRLGWPVYERGRVERQDFIVGEAEPVSVPDGRSEAVPLVREQPDKGKTTTLWVDPARPLTPVRVLQRERGRDRYELRLLELRQEQRIGGDGPAAAAG